MSMPLRHCNECHHEWEVDREECDWCGGDSYILDEETPLSKMCKDPNKLIDIMKKIGK